ncbi:MAG: hypothetical protein O7D91_08135 [Planctomycetota bacterium]|nr:hypothetical protein [Planctomycetota bacterium]
MKIPYIDKRFSSSSQRLIGLANEIIDEFVGKGFRLTLKQLSYQFVARDLLPNNESAYERLGRVINDGRLAGLIDWEAIEDRSRKVQIPESWSIPDDLLKDAVEQYQIDLWASQDYRVEVWIEKEALLGVISGVCEKFRLPHFACKGYNSQSEMWNSGHNRISEYLGQDQIPIILHLGDHDLSGLDMTRDIRERLALFAGEPIAVERIALNMDQIEQYGPPPNPAKIKDSRFASYVKQYGNQSWELDALRPEVLAALIEEHVGKYLNDETWDEALEGERLQRDALRQISDRYDDVQEYLESA